MITVTHPPAENVAAHAPVIVQGTTDRWPFVGGVRYSEAVTGIGDDGGYFTVSLGADPIEPFMEDDTILISGLTGNAAIFNGRHKVQGTGAQPEYVQTFTPWTSVSSTTGTITRMNENLMIKLTVDTLEPIYARVTDGSFAIDIGPVLAQLLSSQFTLSTGDRSTEAAKGSVEYELTFDEVFVAPDYSLTEVSDPTATINDVYAHLSTDIGNMIEPPSLSVSRVPYYDFRAKDKIIYRAYVSPDEITGTFTEVRINFTPNVGSITRVTCTIVDNNILAVYAIPAGVKTVTAQVIKYGNIPDEEPLRNPTTIRVPSNGCGKRLYYLNSMGGWYSYEAHKYEDRTVTKKIGGKVVETYTERTLYGMPEHHSTGLYLADLTDSAEVRDENGTLVEVLTTEMDYRAEQVEPVVRIKLNKNAIR